MASLDAPQVDAIYADMITQQMLSRDLRPNVRGIENVVNIAYEKGGSGVESARGHLDRPELSGAGQPLNVPLVAWHN